MGHRYLDLLEANQKVTAKARIRRITGKLESEKHVEQLIVELNPVLRGWGNYFRTGNADREFHSHFVVQRPRRWQYRRGGQRPTRRPPFTHEQLYAMAFIV